MSLTHYIGSARKKRTKDYFGTDHIGFPKLPKGTEVINPYPKSLFERKLWAVMGTFTDYMIRKMFRDELVTKDADIVKESNLISEYGLDLASKIDTSHEENHNAIEVQTQGMKWIDAYLNTPWDSCIEDSFLMSQLDSIYRTGRIFALHIITPVEREGLEKFLGTILTWLRKDFRDAKRVILNPIYGHPAICKADGDLVIDSTLFDIKTTKNPTSIVRKDKDQLLGYLSLAHIHAKHPISTSPPNVEYSSVGFLLPLSLMKLVVETIKFTKADKEQFCEKIRMLRPVESKIVKEKDSLEPNDSSNVIRMIGSAEWDEAVRMAKKLLENGKGTLVEWQVLLEGLASNGQLDRVVDLSKYLEENENLLIPWETIFPKYIRKGGRMIENPESDYREDFECLFFNIGAALSEIGDPKYALHCFEVFVKRSGVSVTEIDGISVFLTMIHARLGNKEEAEMYWEKASTEDTSKILIEKAKKVLEKQT